MLELSYLPVHSLNEQVTVFMSNTVHQQSTFAPKSRLTALLKDCILNHKHFKWPVFTYANTCMKTSLEIYFIHLGN